MRSDRKVWDSLASKPRPSWYLDPEVALQKKRTHQHLIRRWVGREPSGRVLKTDLFEDAFGLDAVLPDLFEPGTATLLGTDIAFDTVKAALANRAARQPVEGFVCDLRSLPVAPGSLDVVISLSTLDHFSTKAEFDSSLGQLCDALKPGGRMVLTLDNPLNPLYAPLRGISRLGLAPFRLGYAPRFGTLERSLPQFGMEILNADWLIHNPRLLSTAAVLMMRRIAGRRAGVPVRSLLAMFGLLDRLPTRRFTACFYAIHARKR
jgi:SAM-dependent methyltransferase